MLFNKIKENQSVSLKRKYNIFEFRSLLDRFVSRSIMKRLGVANFLLLLNVTPAFAVVHDVTGHWRAGKDIEVLVERQFNTFKVAIISRTPGAVNWGVVSGRATAENGFSARMNVNVPPDGPVLWPSPATIFLDFSDPAHGSLAIGSTNFSMTRFEFVRQGLLAPLNKDGPEVGFYFSPSSRTLAFAEAQGNLIRAVSFIPGQQPVALVTGNLQNTSPTHFGLNGAAFDRQDFEDFSHTLPFPNTGGAYTIPGALEAQISRLPRANSMRLRSSLRANASAFLTYFATPTAPMAFNSMTNALRAFECARKLTPEPVEFDLKASLYQLVFDTDAKASRLLSMESQLGTMLVNDLGVSASNPGECIVALQGVARINTEAPTGPTNAAPANATTQKAEREQAEKARAARKSPFEPRLERSSAGPRSVIGRNASCNATRVIYVSGVKTTDDEAEGQAASLENVLNTYSSHRAEGVTVSSISNVLPGYWNILDAVLRRLGVTADDIRLLKTLGYPALNLVARRYPPAKAALIISAVVASSIERNDSTSRNIATQVTSFINNGYRVVLTPHSHGNILSNDALQFHVSTTLLNHVGMASVASADNRIFSANSIRSSATRDDDRVINNLRRIFPSTLTATITNAGVPPEDSFLRHGFKTAHLDIPKARSAVVSRVDFAWTAAESPNSAITLGAGAGGFTGTQGQRDDYNVGSSARTIEVDYQMYTIPDAMEIRVGSRLLASTGGAVSGTGTLRAAIPNVTGDKIIDVIVYGTDPGTAWDYVVRCPRTNSAI